jgi:hypothetical protein
MDITRNPVITAMRLMRKRDMAIGWRLGKTATSDLNNELMGILRSLMTSEDIPDSVKHSIMTSMRRAANEFDERLAEREIPELEDFLLRLRAVGVPNEIAWSKLTEIKKLSDELSEIDRGIESQRAKKADYMTPQNTIDEANERLRTIDRLTLDLWNDILILSQTVLGAMARFVPPTSPEVADAFNGNP